MATYRAFQVTGQRQFELVDRELVAPSPGHVRFKVQSCGVCHSDMLAVEGMRADPSVPIVPATRSSVSLMRSGTLSPAGRSEIASAWASWADTTVRVIGVVAVTS